MGRYELHVHAYRLHVHCITLLLLLSISVPQEVDCGHCLAGESKTVIMKCDNFGGEGSFKLSSLDSPDHADQENVMPRLNTMVLLSK